eukprot:jgi/Astpho2/2808/Aster-00973
MAACFAQGTFSGMELKAGTSGRTVAVAPPRASRQSRTVCQASNSSKSAMKGKLASFGACAATLLAAGQAQATTPQEIAELAAGGDNRILIIATVFVPVIGWVGFNIIGPGLNQLRNMGNKKRSIATGLGLTAASMLMAQNADAATDVAQIAQKAGDNRILAVAALLTPALGWVLFNIGGPATNQLKQMSLKK